MDLKVQVQFFLRRAYQRQAIESKEDFDPATLSPEEVDVLLAERDVWGLVLKESSDVETLTDSEKSLFTFADNRLKVINGLLVRLAN
jgi:hypothetical protein